jgi:hypothetical protein
MPKFVAAQSGITPGKIEKNDLLMKLANRDRPNSHLIAAKTADHTRPNVSDDNSGFAVSNTGE